VTCADLENLLAEMVGNVFHVVTSVMDKTTVKMVPMNTDAVRTFSVYFTPRIKSDLVQYFRRI